MCETCEAVRTALHDQGGGMPAEVRAQVEMARINAKRDVDVARIQRGETRDVLETEETIAETEAVAQVASAEALAEVAIAPQEEAPSPVAIVMDDPAPEAPAEAGTDLPPAVDKPSEEKPRKPASKSWF